MNRVLLPQVVLQEACRDASLVDFLYTLAPSPILWPLPWGISDHCLLHPPKLVLLPKVGAWALPSQYGLHGNAEAVSYLITKGNFTLLLGVLLSLSFLFPASLSPSAVGPSYLPCWIIPWAKITAAKQLQFEFPLQSLVHMLHCNLTTLPSALSVMAIQW